MQRRELLTRLKGGLLLGGISAMVLYSATGSSTGNSVAEYRDDEYIAYTHESLRLDVDRDVVTRGETISFEVTNTGDEAAIVGCHNPWAIEKSVDEHWHTLAWTGLKYSQLCATFVPPGESKVEAITMSESHLKDRTERLSANLEPGKYRFVLLGPSPFLAIDFEIESP